MRTFLAFAAVLALAVSAAMPVAAHSIKDKGELDRLMGDKEKFFQSLDKEAPDFTPQDADGMVVSRPDLRGQVAVLHFIYAACLDVCPLHAYRIPEIQEMVHPTPKSEKAQSITNNNDPANKTHDILPTSVP